MLLYNFKEGTIHHPYFFGILFFIFLTHIIDDSRYIFSYYQYNKSFRFLNHCRKISVPSLSIIFEGLSLSGGPLRKQTFTSTGSKGHGLWFAIGGSRFVLCVFVAFELACEQALRGGKRKDSLQLGLWNLNTCIEKVDAKCWLAEMTWQLDSQGEIVPIELSNTDETQI